MLFNWLVLLLTLATVTRSEHYHIVPVDSTDLCHDYYRNGTCFALEQLVQTNLLSDGDNLTLSFLPGDHVLTEQLLIRNFSHVQITGQNTGTTVVGFHSNATILFVNNTELSIENLGFVGVNVGPQTNRSMIIDNSHNVYIKDCYFMDFVLLNQVETHIVKIANTQTATIESTLFMNNTGQALHVEADDVYITNSVFTRNDGGAVDIDLNKVLFSNSIELYYNNSWSGGAVEVVSGTLVITSSTFIDNKSQFGGAISIFSGSLSISDSTLTNNSAYGSGGAISIYSGSVFISDCTLTNNRADGGGAIGVFTGNVSISNSELTNNRADSGGGGAIGVSTGSVSISNSELTNNRADYGGVIGVTSGDVSISHSTLSNNRAVGGGAIGVLTGSVSISNSTLTNNRAGFDGGGAIGVNSGSVSVFHSTLTNNRANFGGAIYVSEGGSASIFNSRLANNRGTKNGGGAIGANSGNVSISHSTLTNNRAEYGGAISVSEDSTLSISICELTNNSADKGGAIDVCPGSNVFISDSMVTNSSSNRGVIYASRSNLILNNTNITNNMVSLNINQQSNVTFTGMNIVSNNNGPINASNSRVDFNGPTTLSNNHGVFGGAISADQSQIYINAEGVIITNNTATSGGGIFLRESTLFVNEPIEINQNTAHNGGGIYAYSSRVEFKSVQMVGADTYPNKQSEIAHNIAENGGGIYAVSSSVELTQSYVNIDSNTAATKGGGVYLQQGSKLYIYKNDPDISAKDPLVKLMINNNLAQYGGGIFVADDTESGACRGGATETDATQTIFADCFIQTIKLHSDSIKINHINTFMTNNTATQSGADIFGGLLDRCTASQNAEYKSSKGLDYIIKTVRSTIASISSRPVRLTFCNYSQYDYVSTKKGHTFKISVMAVDQVGNPVNATIQSSVVSESGVNRLKEGQAEQRVGNQCTELEYNVFSQDSSAQVELYAKGPCINLGISRQLINISFLPCTCPVGLKPIRSPIECKCDCDPVLQTEEYQITNCFEQNGTIALERNNNTWIEVINTTNRTEYVVSNCALDYCVEIPINISLSNRDEQCDYNRSGVLCGECEPGLSLVLATSNCQECSNLYLLLLIPFVLAGILLVALILVLNITIATGNLHGIIFYANIVAANRAIFFPSLNNFLTVFISWVNLDLGINTCFYDGMNSQAKVLLQLAFPTYLFLLILLIIVLSKYFDSFAKLLSNRNPVAALGTLVLLSYSKFLRFIVAALQSRVLEYSDGSIKTVWLFDGNVTYFTSKHIPQFVAAIIILIAGGLFTVVLFFGQWFPRCSKVMIWTKNTYYIGFMDAYHAPFTPKHRYWVGLLLFALIAHNLVAAMAADTSLPVLSAGCIAFELISLNNRVHKKQFNGYLETFFLLNLGILSIGTSYVVETHRQQETLINVSMSIAFILFVIIISYHFHHFILKKTKIWLKIKEVTKNLRTGAADKKNQQPNNAMAMHHLAAIDDDEQLKAEHIDLDMVDPPSYTDGAVEQADPDRYITPPIIRPATRPDQLREPALDVLAPLTTEDYRRPAPPPPRVNHRPVVTHTEIGPIRNEV
ncbi:uncharacterized protein LOC135337227 [Halichondria panicea]|uniref:uncharacterized protein LOC135337227 n=1 Tax=Halichondria panicea TaxID=6063 RepID=UPI00312B75CE